MQELSKTYNPETVEQKWYDYWKEQGIFNATPDERPPYTIVIPPPNVTGVLHMGHMLNNTIQDILVRRARMKGFNALWVPGTDHASIATEAKVVQMLRAQGIKKSDLTREEFLKHAWEWTNKFGGIILQQLEKLGASCDWNRTRFTMDPAYYRAVIKVFIDLYNKGYIYRGLRMVNWDCEALTAVSNEEVQYAENGEKSFLYSFRYEIKDSQGEYIIIATQRPETIMGDTAIAVNPSDPRFAHLVGKTALVPLINKSDFCDSILVINVKVHPTYLKDTICNLCKGGSVVVGSSTYFNAGKYTENLQTIHGCDSIVKFEIKIINFAPTFTIVKDTLKTVKIEGAEYQWYECKSNAQIPFFGAIGHQFVVLKSGKYALGITYKGCTYISDCIDVIISSLQDSKQSTLLYYPNPFTGVLNIKTEPSGILKVISLRGEILQEFKLSDGEQQVDLQDLVPGSYLMLWNDGSKLHYFKLLKH